MIKLRQSVIMLLKMFNEIIYIYICVCVCVCVCVVYDILTKYCKYTSQMKTATLTLTNVTVAGDFLALLSYI